MPNFYGQWSPDVPAVAPGNQTWLPGRLTKRGEIRTIDWITEMLMEGRGFQVRAGTIATGLSAQNVIADTSADLAMDANSGQTVIPIQLGIAMRDVATTLTVQVALKGVTAISTSGTAFVPLPLRQGGIGSVSQGRVQADTVVVPAEVATTTRRIFEYENAMTQAPTTFYSGLPNVTIAAAAAQLQYVADGPACMYLQVASTTAQALWFGHLNVIELLTTSIG